MNFEEKVYLAIKQHVEEHGYSPTYREIMTMTGIKTTSHVQYYVNRLSAKGRVTFTPNQYRTVRVVG